MVDLFQCEGFNHTEVVVDIIRQELPFIGNMDKVIVLFIFNFAEVFAEMFIVVFDGKEKLQSPQIELGYPSILIHD